MKILEILRKKSFKQLLSDVLKQAKKKEKAEVLAYFLTHPTMVEEVSKYSTDLAKKLERRQRGAYVSVSIEDGSPVVKAHFSYTIDEVQLMFGKIGRGLGGLFGSKESKRLPDPPSEGSE